MIIIWILYVDDENPHLSSSPLLPLLISFPFTFTSTLLEHRDYFDQRPSMRISDCHINECQQCWLLTQHRRSKWCAKAIQALLLDRPLVLAQSRANKANEDMATSFAYKLDPTKFVQSNSIQIIFPTTSFLCFIGTSALKLVGWVTWHILMK